MFKIILLYLSYLTLGWKAHVNARELHCRSIVTLITWKKENNLHVKLTLLT